MRDDLMETLPSYHPRRHRWRFSLSLDQNNAFRSQCPLLRSGTLHQAQTDLNKTKTITKKPISKTNLENFPSKIIFMKDFTFNSQKDSNVVL